MSMLWERLSVFFSFFHNSGFRLQFGRSGLVLLSEMAWYIVSMAEGSLNPGMSRCTDGERLCDTQEFT